MALDGVTVWSYAQILLSYLSGGMFVLGWWLFFDTIPEIVRFQLDPVNADINPVFLGYFLYWIPGVVSTVAHVLINIVPWSALATQPFGMDMVGLRARIWLMVAFIIGFVGVIMSFWFGIEFFVFDYPYTNIYPLRSHKLWIVCAEVILQNVLIFGSAVVFRFGPRMVIEKKDEMDDF